MKAKTIKKILQAKFENFASSITDEALAKQVRDNGIITGGCIASMLLGEKVNDYDIYFRDFATTKAVAEYYVAGFLKNHAPKNADGVSPVGMTVKAEDGRVKIMIQSAGVAGEGSDKQLYQYFEQRPDDEAGSYVDAVTATDEKPVEAVDELKPDYRPVFLSANAITLSGGVQLIIRFYGEPEAIHSNYDFVHCMSYWTSIDNNLVLNPLVLQALLEKELKYCGSKYPLCSIIRTRKFVARGWTINAGQFLKMAMQLNDLNLKDVNVLEDQLTGVDAAYFQQLIAGLRDVEPEKINAMYISTIIDRIF